jgi:hypothetical protein
MKRIPLKDLSDGLGLCRVIMEEDFKRAIRTIPDGTIIDVAPVVHGRWIEKSAPARKIYFECSHCGAQENKHTAIKGYYCWRCGAKMDGGGGDAAD